VFLFINFFVNLGGIAWQIARGRLSVAREEFRVEAQLEEGQKER
jgi:hypothetical protein